MLADDQLDTAADLAREGQLEAVFATPVFSHMLKDAEPLNAQLRDVILEAESKIEGVARSNLGGWQSAPDFFEWDSPSVTTLQRHVAHALNVATLRLTGRPNLAFRFDLFGWAAVNRDGHYNTTHVHPTATWSGIYYVHPGDERPGEHNGLLELVHPVAASVMSFFPNILPSARIVQPKAGMLILFPSYLQHHVRVYRGARPRICVPFNAHLRSVG
jgi:uncharacterized protein (TIGR02466 family)